MEEKKVIKVRLSTVVYLFIILILVIALGVVYYLGFVRDDTNNMLENRAATEKSDIYANQEKQETNNNVEEEPEEIASEQNTNKYKGEQAINIIAKEDTKFVINEIKNNGDTSYIINATILEKESRKVSEEEYKNILEGQEVIFRDIKWKYNKSNNDEGGSIFLESVEDYNNTKSSNKIALTKSDNEGTRYFTNIAGDKVDLCDYSDIKVEFEVSKNIKVCSYWGEFKYDNGELVCKYIVNENEEITPETIDVLIEFCNNKEPGTSGTYEECIAYVSNGKIDAIKIFEK